MRAFAAFPPPDETTASSPLWILRVGVAACFIGHGMLGVNQTAAWTSYFAVVGISQQPAMTLMPWVGAFDVAMGLSVLFHPLRGVVFYMAVWALWTALLRPLAGEPFWEAVERAGNYGSPFALFLSSTRACGIATGFGGQCRETIEAWRHPSVAWTLRLTTAFELFGHGALGCALHKAVVAAQYTLIGLPGATAEPMIGAFECLLALAVLLRPGRTLLLGVVGWKLATEALYPVSGSSLWVFVEHGGSYAAPLALAFIDHETRLAHAASASMPARRFWILPHD